MKEKLKKLKFLLTIIGSTSIILTSCNNKSNSNSNKNEKEKIEEINENVFDSNQNIVDNKVKTDISINAVGDCTLGTDTNFGYEKSFTNVLDNNNRDFSYFFSGVYNILSEDDLTIANLETTFTNSNNRVEKTFNFKGDYDYVNILKEGSIEAVNVANNHTYDYGEDGFNDTINTLNKANIINFGYGNYSVIDIKGIKIGLAGLPGWDEDTAKTNTIKAINYFKENKTNLIIMTYHWGKEREYNANETQKNIARFAIDEGADLVIGHHPHVLQELEYYNGKPIAYSLGNFVFGGNKNPNDKDTSILQVKFHFEDKNLTNIDVNVIPCSLSSQKNINDYKPIIVEDEEKERILKKIIK